MSGRFTPAARTRMRIWPSAGCGRGISTAFSASAGPRPPSTAMAVMVSLIGCAPPAVIGELALICAARLDSAPSGNRKGRPHMDEPAEVRVQRGQRLLEAMREDLELFGVAELEERIEVLQSEIARVQAQIDRKRAGRAAADALFG